MNPLEKTNLLIVGGFPEEGNNSKGGIIDSCRILVSHLPKDKFRIITLDSSQISNPPPRFLKRLFLATIRLKKYIFLLYEQKPDAILVFCSSGASAIEKSIMLSLGKIVNAKTLVFPRGEKLIYQTYSNAIFRYIISRLFQSADIFLSQGEKWEVFAEEILKFKKKHIIRIPNWTATPELIEIGEGRSNITISDSANFIFIGWVEEHKGVFELIRVCRKLQEEGRSFSLSIVGDGRSLKDLKHLASDYSLEDKINFLGWKTSAEVLKLLETHNIFVLPSWNEGMPNSMIQAMSAKLAIIVSDVGVISSYLIDEEHALFCNRKDEDSLYRSMSRIIEDIEFRTAIALNAFKLSKEIFTPESSIQKIAKAIHD